MELVNISFIQFQRFRNILPVLISEVTHLQDQLMLWTLTANSYAYICQQALEMNAQNRILPDGAL